MSNTPKPPFQRPWEPGPSCDANDLAEETIGHVKRGGKFLLDFLLSDGQKDAIAITRAIAQFRPELLEPSSLAEHAARIGRTALDSCVHQPRCQGPRCTVYASPAAAGDAYGDDDQVVVIIDETPAPCSFCKGRPVVSLNRATNQRTAIACPQCNAAPQKPRATARLGR